MIIFDDTLKQRVVNALGYVTDGESRLVDSDGKIVTSQEFEKINLEAFGGLLRGSKIPIKNEESELVKYFTAKNS